MSQKAACQLLTAVDDGEKAAAILLNPLYAVQQKFDGKRIILNIERGGSITAHNRDGITCSVSPEILRDARSFLPLAPLTFDGEWLRQIRSFQAFDLIQLAGTDIAHLSFQDRQTHLIDTFKVAGGDKTSLRLEPTIAPARTEYLQEGKVALLQQIHNADLEGIVLKHIHSPYKRDRQPDQYKHKFTAVSSFIVTKLNEKQSVAIGVFDENGKLIPCGDVKIRNSRFKLTEGMIIDVRYMHAFPSHKVYQPRMLSIRDDLRPQACVISQLRYKGTKTAIII